MAKSNSGFSVNLEALQGAASNLEKLRMDYFEKCKALNKRINVLTSKDWEGTDSKAFRDNFENFSEKLKKMEKFLEETAVHLKKVKKGYEMVQQGNANRHK